jgi:hypothetical protein
MDLIRVGYRVVRNSIVKAVAHRAFEVRDLALKAQVDLLAALNLPTADDIAALARAVRSLSQRLEVLEDTVARIDQGVGRLQAAERRSQRPPVVDG